jgi:hypothetical protein
MGCMSKKLTVQELIAQKEKLVKKKERTETLYIASMDAEIVIKVPTNALLLEAQGLGQEDATKADIYLVYQCCVEPNLKDPKLQEAFGCVEPMDVVSEIFLPGEVAAIADKIMGLGGFSGGVTVKN